MREKKKIQLRSKLQKKDIIRWLEIRNQRNKVLSEIAYKEWLLKKKDDEKWEKVKKALEKRKEKENQAWPKSGKSVFLAYGIFWKVN